MRRIFVLLFLLALGLFAVPSVKAADHVEALAPLLDEQTFMIGRLDLSKVKLDKLVETIQEGLEKQTEMIGEENTPDMAMMPMLLGMFAQQIEENILDPLVNKAGVTDVYLISSLSHLVDPESDEYPDQIRGSFPCAIILPWKGKTEPQQRAIRNMFADSEMFHVRFPRFGFYFAIPSQEFNSDDIAETVKNVFTKIEAKERSEVAEAFTALKDCDLQLILMQPKGYKDLSYEQIINSFVEELEVGMDIDLRGDDDSDGVDPFGPEDSPANLIKEQLTSGIRWTAIGLNLEKPHLDWVVQSNGPGGAKKTEEAAKKLLGTFVDRALIDIDNEGIKKEDITTLFELFLPKETKNEQLSIRYDQAFIEKNQDAIKEKAEKVQEVNRVSLENMKGMNNLKQMMLAVHNYHDVNNSLPASSTETKDKKPLHSWRVALLPYMEQRALYDSIRRDEPWDSEHNKQFHSKMPNVYASPELDEASIKKGLTKYAMIVGPEAAFAGPNKWASLARITDGTSNTFGISERTKPVCWMDPTGDISQESAMKGINKKIDDGIGNTVKQKGKSGAYFARLDGSVQFVEDSLDLKTLKAMITCNGGESISVPYPDGNTNRANRVRPRKVGKCENNIKQLGLAMHNFHDTFGRMPAASEPIMPNGPRHSWRVRLLPFLEEAALYDSIRFDEPWDSEHNKQFHDQMPVVYQCRETSKEDAEKGLTHYALVIGKNTAFVDADKQQTFAFITDGLSNTLFVTEKKKPVCWMDPDGDIDINKIKKGINKDDDGIGSPHTVRGKNGVYVGMFDGSVRFFPETMDVQELKNIIDPSDGNVVTIP